MWRFEVGSAVIELVDLDDDEACDAGGKRGIIDACMDVCALFLLLGGVGGLEDEDALG